MERCIKSEESSGKRVISSTVEDGGVQETKCTKRRRKSPSLVTLGYSEKQHPGSFQLGQAAASGGATTTTTTKRSSRFRGVSRCVYILSCLKKT